MSDENNRQLRVLHIVSAGGVAKPLQQSLFMPLLTRTPKERVRAQVVCLAPGAVPSPVLRQNGVPVHDAALSRQRFSLRSFSAVVKAARDFRPDVIQAWGYTAQIVSGAVRNRCDWKPKLVWSIANTAPLARDAGFIDRQKVRLAARRAARVDRIVYASEAGAAQHRRVGFPEGGYLAISPGVDAARFKQDPAARTKVREQLEISPQSLVIGMLAPFRPEFDHATLLKALGELIKTNPELVVVLAGHGAQKGNGPLMALIGGGALGTRAHLLGEWSDAASLFNACDIVCSSALNDDSRMTLAMAMLCGVPCVATGMGAQGELIGQHGVAIEPGSPAAFVKGITRIMQLTPEKRAQMVQGARKHALKEFVYVRSLQKYLQMYVELVSRESQAAEPARASQAATLTPTPALPVGESAAPAQTQGGGANVDESSRVQAQAAAIDEPAPEQKAGAAATDELAPVQNANAAFVDESLPAQKANTAPDDESLSAQNANTAPGDESLSARANAAGLDEPTPVQGDAALLDQPSPVQASLPPAGGLMPAAKVSAPRIDAPADPDSLETKVAEQAEQLPKWRLEQEQRRAELEARQASIGGSDGDVLEIFESSIAADTVSAPASELTIAEDEVEELLAPEALEMEERAVQRAATSQAGPTKIDAAPPDAKMSAIDRMRAAAREELKRAAAAMAPTKSKAPAAEPAPQAEFQLELLPEPGESRKRASG